jgi:hypothetical protein
MSHVTAMLMTSQTRNDVISRFVDYGFLLVFNTCFESTVYRSLVIGVFFEVNNGRLLIWAARGRRKLEVLSPLDSATTVTY